MNRKKLLLLLLVLLMPICFFGKSKQGCEVMFSCRHTKQQYCHKRHHRMPLAPLMGILRDHELKIEEAKGAFFELSNEDGVVYSGFLSMEGEIMIPSDISGSLNMIIYKGDSLYVAMIDFD